MRLAAQREYREYTLLLFESRVHENGAPTERHWIVIAPDGINIVGAPRQTEADARAFVDSLIGSEKDQPSARAGEQPSEQGQ